MADEKRKFKKAVSGSDLETRLKSFIDMDNQSTLLVQAIKSVESSPKGGQTSVLDQPDEISEAKEPQTEALEVEVEELRSKLEAICLEVKNKDISIAHALADINNWKAKNEETRRLFDEERSKVEELTKRVDEEKAKNGLMVAEKEKVDQATAKAEEEARRADFQKERADSEAARAKSEKERADTAEAAVQKEKERADQATAKAEEEARRADFQKERADSEAASTKQAKSETDVKNKRADDLQAKLESELQKVLQLEVELKCEKARADEETLKAAEEKLRADKEATGAQLEKDRADTLEKTIAEMKAEAETLEVSASEIDDLKRKVQELEEQLKSTKEKSPKKIGMDEDSDNMKFNFEENNKILRKDIKRHEQSIVNMTKLYDELSAEKENLQKVVAEYQSESSPLRSTINDLERRLADTNLTLEAKTTKLDEADSKLEDYRVKEIEWKSEREQLVAEQNKREAEKSAEIQVELAKKMDKVIDELEKNKKELEDVVEENERIKKQSDDQSSEHTVEIEKLKEEVSIAKSYLDHLLGECKQAREEVMTLQRKISESEKEVRLKDKQIASSGQKVQEIEADFSALKEAHADELSKLKDSLEQQVNSKEKQLSDLRNELSGLRSKLQELEKVNQKQSEEPSPVADTTLDTQREKLSLISEKMVVEPSDNKIDTRKVKLQAKIDEVKINIEEKEKQLKSTNKMKKDKKQSLQKEIDTLNQELSGLQTELTKLDEMNDTVAEVEQVPPPKILVEKVEPTESPVQIPDIQQPPVDVKSSQDFEGKLILENEEKESLIVEWRMYLEKLIDHIALLDIEMREHNHEIEEIAKKVAEAEKFKNCQTRIVEVLKRTIHGITAIGQQENIDTSSEVELLQHDVELIEKTSPKETKFVGHSARAILVLDNPREITESVVQEERVLADQVSNFVSQISAPQAESQLVSSEQHRPDQELPLDQRFANVKDEFLQEIDADKIPVIIDSIRDFFETLENNSADIDLDTYSISVLRNASEKLQRLLKTSSSANESVESANKSTPVHKDETAADLSVQKDAATVDSPQDDAGDRKQAELARQLEEVEESLEAVKAEAVKKREEVDSLGLKVKAVEHEIVIVEREIKALEAAAVERREKLAARRAQLDKDKSVRERALEEDKQSDSETLHLLENKCQTAKHDETTQSKPQLQRQSSDHSSADSVVSRESTKRKNLREAEHVSVSVNPPTEVAPDELISINEDEVEKIINDLRQALKRQHHGIEDLNSAKQKFTNLKLVHEKIIDNIAVHEASLEDVIKDIAGLDKQIEATRFNLEARRHLSKLLTGVVEEARKLHGSELIAKVGEETLNSLEQKQSELQDSITKREANMLARGQVIGTNLFAGKIADSIRQLVVVAQSGSLGQIKAICFMSDLPNVISDDSRSEYQRISSNIECHLDDLESIWTEMISGSKIAESLNDYILKAVSYETEHVNRLDALLDSIYSEMNSRRSARSSPDSKK
jgi:hypothetical protein